MSDKGTPNNSIKKDARVKSGIFVHFVLQFKIVVHRRRVCPNISNYSLFDPTLS